MSEKPGYMSASGITVDLRDIRRIVNDVYYSLLSNYDRYLVLYGSAGSGKSHFAAQKILFRILLGMERGVTHTFLVLRKTAPAARKSLIALFRHYISEWGLGRLVRYNKGDMVFEFVNGARILAGGLDDPEKIKSIEGLTGAWLEEATEFDEQDFMQVDLRLRGRVATYKQIMLTFNPTACLEGYNINNNGSSRLVSCRKRDKNATYMQPFAFLCCVKIISSNFHDILSIRLFYSHPKHCMPQCVFFSQTTTVMSFD